jgi:hypothetical protein
MDTQLAPASFAATNVPALAQPRNHELPRVRGLDDEADRYADR